MKCKFCNFKSLSKPTMIAHLKSNHRSKLSSAVRHCSNDESSGFNLSSLIEVSSSSSDFSGGGGSFDGGGSSGDF